MSTDKSIPYPWDDARIVLVCGSGGVGKTSISAALGLKYAEAGYKTLVLTVDPAKRLAQAIGLDEVSGEIKAVKKKSRNKTGSLDAMMLNTKRTFDHIVERYSPDKNSCEEVLKHPLYKHLSSMIAGSQEYMAMENLYLVAKDLDYEKIIVDTPPATHALDFIDAPKKMVGAITNSVLKLLVRPSVWASKGSGKLIRIFGSVTGIQFIQEVSDFLSSTVTLLDGFKERAGDVTRLITSEDTNIILVTTPTRLAISDASDFLTSLKKRGLDVCGCIINQASPKLYAKKGDITKAKNWCARQKDKKLQLLGKHLANIEQRELEETNLVAGLKKRIDYVECYTIPRTSEEIHNLDGLKNLYSSLG